MRGATARLARTPSDIPSWIVLAGPNAVGKTTILQGIAAGVLGSRGMRRLINPAKDSWIRAGRPQASCSVVVAPGHRDELEASLPDGITELRATTRIGPELEEEDEFTAGGERFGLTTLHRVVRTEASTTGWMFAAYGASRFDSSTTSIAEELASGPPRESAVSTLFRRDASLYSANEWSRRVFADYLAMAVDRGGRNEGLTTDNWVTPTPRESFVQNRFWALHLVLNRVFCAVLGNGHNRIELTSNGIVVRTGAGPQSMCPVRFAGQGLESLALLVTDIVRQLAAFFDHSFLGGVDARLPDPDAFSIAHSGVVLIDEAENHLHPQLERVLRKVLTSVFPNVQFIVTTHSPFIAQTADDNGLYRVEQGGRVMRLSRLDQKAVRTGTIDDVILTNLFGLDEAYSEETRSLRDELVKLQARVLLDEASDADAARISELQREAFVGPSLDRAATLLAELAHDLTVRKGEE